MSHAFIPPIPSTYPSSICKILSHLQIGLTSLLLLNIRQMSLAHTNKPNSSLEDCSSFLRGYSKEKKRALQTHYKFSHDTKAKFPSNDSHIFGWMVRFIRLLNNSLKIPTHMATNSDSHYIFRLWFILGLLFL